MSQTKNPGARRALTGLTACTFLCLLALRARSHLQHPDVWQEDASNLLGWQKAGLLDLLEPINGYLLVVPKLITHLAAWISIYHYPIISIVLSWMLTLAVCMAVSRAPLQIKGGPMLAAACLLTPALAEVFGLPLYTFWWTSILLLLLPLWQGEQRHLGPRLAIVVLASLSSPVCAVVMPLMWARAFLARKTTAFRDDKVLALAMTACVAVQLWAMHEWGVTHQEPASTGATLQQKLGNLQLVIPRFLGAFLVGNTDPAYVWPSGLWLLTFLALALHQMQNRWAAWVLASSWLGLVLMTTARVDLHIIATNASAPRYFFLPFILTSWILIHTAASQGALWARGMAVLLLLVSLHNLPPVVHRTHQPLNWALHLASCASFDQYRIPVQADGDKAHAWPLDWSGATCRQLIQHDWFRPSQDVPTAAFRVIGTYPDKNRPPAQGLPGMQAVVQHNWLGKDYPSQVEKMDSLPGHDILGTFLESDAETGVMLIRLHRGDQIWLRSEPESHQQHIRIVGLEDRFSNPLPSSSDWVLIEFSNDRLPGEFTVQLTDGGGGWGEWMAVSLQTRH